MKAETGRSAAPMKQQTFSDIEYSSRRRKTKREEFLDSMNEIIPWDHGVEIIRPYYYNNKRGRRARDLEMMLRMYLMQNWFNLSDEGMEEAIYDSYAMRNFLGINFLDEQVPDATTLLHFRHLLEKHKLGEKIFEDVTERLEKAGLIMHGGSIVDATIIAAPSSTKNKEGKRDPEMHQTKKGNEWRFGMKCHIGVDAFSGLVHTIEVTSANVHDICVTSKLIREDDEVVYGDSGYLGIEKREEIVSDEHLSSIDYRINRRPSSLQKVSDHSIDWDRVIEHAKSSVRCKVEHPFRTIKCLFGYRKAAYKGLAKNESRLYALFASANLYALASRGRSLASAW